MVYRVISDRAELRYGARFTLRRFPVGDGALCLFKVGQRLIMGRHYSGWIVRPQGRWIRINKATFKNLGAVIPIVE